MSADDMMIEQTETPKEQEKPKEVPRPMPTYIEVNERGLVTAKNNSELLRFCNAMIASGVVPKQFDKPEKLFGALQFTRSLGLPDVAVRQVAVIQGSPSLWGDLPLALCQQSKEMTYFKESWFDEKYNVICFENKNLNAEVYGAVCFVSRNDSEVQSFSYTLDDAKKAGQYPAPAAMPWTKHTRIMLRYKARSIALKSIFADKLNGVSIAEYDHDTTDPKEIKDVTPEQELAKQLNSTN